MSEEAARLPAEESGPIHDWGCGGGVLAGCVDLLVAVLCGLADPLSDPTRFGVRDLAPWLGAAAFLSMALGPVAWRWGAGGLWAAAILHAGIGAAGWVLVPERLHGIPRPVFAAILMHAVAAAMAIAAAAAALHESPGPAARKASGAARGAAENLESVLVAIVFALVIRHFAVEAYKIPTESMSPTLLGESSRRGPGDRVLVAKWPALLWGPDRWEIWVFRPPLDRTINYVKRVAGLPGETVEIQDGDLYVDGKIARKPPRTREEMWFPVWPRADGAEEKASPWAGEGFKKEGDGFTVSGAKERRLLRYERPVVDAAWGSGGSNPVGDVRLRFEVDAAEPKRATELVVRITGRGGPCEVRISADGALLAWTANGRENSGNFRSHSSPVREMEVSFADLVFEAKVDGTVVVHEEVEAPSSASKRASFGVSFGVGKGGATFRDLRLDRDVFYTPTGTTKFTVPEGHYLFLGDNSAHSQDARMWNGFEIREAGGEGRVFYSAQRPAPLAKSGRLEFTDRNGVFRSYEPGALKFSETSVPMSFVPAADLHGRAFAVFWPPRWFTRIEGGRVRFLP